MNMQIEHQTSGNEGHEVLTLGQSGQTTYCIYIDPNAPESVRLAAEELRSYFEKVGGFAPDIVASDTPPLGAFISLGTNAATRAEGFDADAIPDAGSVPHDGFRWVTRGQNLFILGPDTATGQLNTAGGETHGTANGVYAFIEEYLGVRWLMPGEVGQNVPRRDAITVPVLDRTEVSPFHYRAPAYIGIAENIIEWKRHMRLAMVADVAHHHAWEVTVPPSLFDEHPEWFPEVGGKRLAPTGRYKLETTNPDLVQFYADAVIAAFRHDPALRWYSISPSDGGFGWSESAETLALTERDPTGELSRTPLVLKFYNDVARIVGKEFPDRKLGGYIYSSYLYPPADGIPPMEPNLAFIVAPNFDYGYQLYREDRRAQWESVLSAWGTISQDVDLYYYDLPNLVLPNDAVLMPPAPEIMNFVFSSLAKYGFKGAHWESNSVYPTYGQNNYAVSKLLWNPNQDAHELLREYYTEAYGAEAGAHIEQFWKLLDEGYREYYVGHTDANYALKPTHLTEIFAPRYEALETHFLQATQAATEPKQQHRLKLLGQVISLMQWNLRIHGALPQNFQSSLTMTGEQIDELLIHPDPELLLTARTARHAYHAPGTASPAKEAVPVNNSLRPVVVPLSRNVRILLYARETGEVVITCKYFDGAGGFVRYNLFDDAGNILRAGAVRTGGEIRFSGEAGKTYLLDAPNRGGTFLFEINGAATAYHGNARNSGLFLFPHLIEGENLSLYFFVPEGIDHFSLSLTRAGMKADLLDPSGQTVKHLETGEESSVRAIIEDVQAGYWQLRYFKPASDNIYNAAVILDEKLPQWFMTDPAHLLQITDVPMEDMLIA
jgi:hypothetical protein